MSGRVLITGGTGLIGRRTIRFVKQAGFEVVALTRSGHVDGADITIACNLLNAEDRRRAIREARASHLLHLAWHDAPQGRWTAPENLDWAVATISLVRQFSEYGGKHVVAAGSCAEYDWSYQDLGEETPLKPSTLYGTTKATTGLMLTGAADTLNLRLAWARIFFCYGPGEPRGRLLGDLIQGLSAGEHVPCTDGLQERDFLHTDDIARAMVTLLSANVKGPINVASGQATRVREMIELTADLMGRRDLIDLGARPRPSDDPPRLVARIDRLEKLGFKPSFDLRSGLLDCLSAAGVELT